MADLKTCAPLTRASVITASELIQDHVHQTPVVTNSTINLIGSIPRTEDELAGTEWMGRTPAKPIMRFWFKCENLQRVGAFKVRGAFHAVEKLKREPGWKEGGGFSKGVATHSSGMYWRPDFIHICRPMTLTEALALAARESGIPAHVVMPSISPASKIAATKGYGASVYFSGSTAPEREQIAAEVIEKTGARLVPPYDHPDIILGQGTVGLELQAQASEMISEAAARGSIQNSPTTPESALPHNGRFPPPGKTRLDAIMAPVSGGGLLSGIALSAEGTGTAVFGAEPSFEGADETRRSYITGERIAQVSSLTIADGLRAPVGVLPWGIMYERGLVKQIFAVTEQEIKKTLKLVLERMKMVVEPSGVVPLAVALWNEDFRSLVEQEGGEDGWDIGLVFSGGNIAVDALAKLYGS
ncbi:Serine racemase [Ceratocystis fimbriata CBS 114723]|uniref:Serine racemase n=1 Tax=Ceratocystis fimbriata CBS 114723 TaxID=1035309 RepID=A0A2C5XLS0_9PEZI|nr:Serine racemase [Ceratocystis fimbriata CBS 114723]